jgi:hypothetical protein
VQWKCDYRNQILRWHPSSLNIKSEAVLRLTRSLRFFHYFVVSSFHVLLLRPYGDGNKRKPAFWSAFLHSLHVVCHLLTHRFRFGATSLQFRSHTKLHTLFVRDHLPYFSVNISFAAAAVIPALHILPVDCRYYIIKRRFNRCIKLGAHVYPSRSGFLVLGRCTHAIETWRSRSNGWVGVVLCGYIRQSGCRYWADYSDLLRCPRLLHLPLLDMDSHPKCNYISPASLSLSHLFLVDN